MQKSDRIDLAAQNKPRLNALTSLRFFAAAMIVAGHSHHLFGSLGLATHLSLAQGVSFFFVLSGFILAYNYPNIGKDLPRFYFSRFARLWPLHIAALMALPLIAGTWNTGNLNELGKVYVFIGNLLLIQAWIPFRDSFLTFNGVAWSISTEAFFYILFPAAMLLMRRSGVLLLLIAASLTVIFMWMTVHFKITMDVSTSELNAMGTIYVNPLARFFEFALGMLTCRIFMVVRPTIHAGNMRNSAVWSVAEVIAIALALFSMHITPRLPLWNVFAEPWVPVVQYYLVSSGSAIPFAALILVFSFGRGLPSRLISTKVLVFLGEASFALYLFHATVILWFQQHASISTGPYGAVLFWLSVLAIASLAHLAIEKPFRSMILGVRRTSLQPVKQNTSSETHR